MASAIALLAQLPQTDCPLENHFAPGVYLRVITMPAGTVVIGHKHNTEHMNIVLTGKARVYSEGITQEIKAPYIFKSGIGAQKALLILEDMMWATIHPTDETDLQVLEDTLITKIDPALAHEELKRMGENK